MLLGLLLSGLALAEDELNFDGGFSGEAAAYKAGTPVSISHNGGNISIRCMDTEGISARIKYNLRGSSQPAMQAYSDGVGMAVYGDSKGGSVKTRIPSVGNGVNSVDMSLTISIPAGTSALTVSQSGAGWVEILNCSGALKVTGGTGGVYASGKYTSVTATAAGANVVIEQDKDTPWTGTSTLSAPAGNITVTMATGQIGKFSAAGAEVSVQPLVMGSNTPTLVSGTMGTGGPTITLKARDRVEVKNP